jgi:hypothetical protein
LGGVRLSALCSFSVSASGAVTLFNGTGMYAGLKGTARVTETLAGVGVRYATGPKKGPVPFS